MDNLRIWGKGLRFGLMLQLAVGPVCLLVLNAAANHGLLSAMSVVVAVTLVDTLYLTLSALGVSAVLRRPSVRRNVQWIGGLALAFFGLDFISGALGFSILPGFSSLVGSAEGRSIWLQGLLVTLSNPLTIVFWGSVLTEQISREHWHGGRLALFSIGCISATLIFLSGVAFAGTYTIALLPATVIRWLNALVGLALVIFGLRMIARKVTPEACAVSDGSDPQQMP